MNREERRRAGISKENADRLKQLNSPCTVMEAVKLAQGVSEDAISNYHKSINPIIVSLSIQIEVLKELLFKRIQVDEHISKTGVLSEEEFIKLFEERVNDYNKQKEEAIKQMAETMKAEAEESQEEESSVEEDAPTADVKTNVSPFPVQVEITKKEN